MLIKLPAAQIPIFWEAIKYAVVQAGEIEEADVPIYLNILLNDLLSDNSQCFVRLGNNKELLGLLVTKIIANKYNGVKTLLLRAVYSWKSVGAEEWDRDYPLVKDFAAHIGCKYITYESRNPKIWHLSERVGFKEDLRSYTYRMET